MEVYFVFFAVTAVLSFLEIFSKNNNRLKKHSLFLVYVLSVFIVGTRWEMATDWPPYYQAFQASYNLSQVIQDYSSMEPVYLFFNWLIRSFTNDYSVFLIIHALVFYYLILSGLKKLTAFPITAYIFFFFGNLGVVGSNRQLIAVAIIFYSMSLVISKNWRYFANVFLAFLFHNTAIIASVYYYIDRRFNKKVLFGSILLATVLGFSSIPSMMFGLLGGISSIAENKVGVYVDGSSGAPDLSILGLLRRVLLLFVFIAFRDRLEKYFPKYNFYLNAFVISMLIYLLFGSTLIILVNRGSLYFNVIQCILLTSFLYSFKRNDTKIVFLLCYLMFSILSMYQSIAQYPDLFDPYQGLWYNKNFFRYLY